jgi:hypothetical protein
MGRHQPALLGGLFIGVLSSLPVVSVLNLCCCLWVVMGGVLVTYLQQQKQPDPLETADAVVAGLVAGVVGAVISGLVSYLVFGEVARQALQEVSRQFEGRAEVPSWLAEAMRTAGDNPAVGLLQLFVTMPVYGVFSLLGALLGLAFFRKKTTAPPPASGAVQGPPQS